MKEMSEMDLRLLKESLALTELMRKQNQAQEEQIKADDVNISASVAEGQPLGADNPPNQEVPRGL